MCSRFSKVTVTTVSPAGEVERVVVSPRIWLLGRSWEISDSTRRAWALRMASSSLMGWRTTSTS